MRRAVPGPLQADASTGAEVVGAASDEAHKQRGRIVH